MTLAAGGVLTTAPTAPSRADAAASAPRAATLVVDRGSATFSPARSPWRRRHHHARHTSTRSTTLSPRWPPTARQAVVRRPGARRDECHHRRGRSPGAGVVHLLSASSTRQYAGRSSSRGAMHSHAPAALLRPAARRPDRIRGPRGNREMRPARVRMLPTATDRGCGPTRAQLSRSHHRRSGRAETRVASCTGCPSRWSHVSAPARRSPRLAQHYGQPTSQPSDPGGLVRYRVPADVRRSARTQLVLSTTTTDGPRTARTTGAVSRACSCGRPTESRLRLPAGVATCRLLISDRSFRADNSLTDPSRHGVRMVGHHGEMAWVGPKAPPDDATVRHARARQRPLRAVPQGQRTRYRCVSSTRRTSRVQRGPQRGRPLLQYRHCNGLLRGRCPRPRALGPASVLT
jgi:hypothetical protein